MKRKPPFTFYALLILPFLISAWGVVVILAMTGWSLHSPAARQLLWFLISLAACGVILGLPLERWYRGNLFFYGLCLVALIMTFLPGVGVSVNGANRWVALGPVRFQPAEAITLVLPLMLARMYHKCPYPTRAGLISAALMLLPVGLMALQPDFGSILVAGGVVGGMFVDCYGFFWPLVSLLVVGPLAFLYARTGHRGARLAMWLDPWIDPMGKGYQVIQGLIAFANGGVWGIGIHRSQDFLPELHNDFIFPAMGEQFGLAGTLSMLAAFAIFFYFALRAYRRTRGVNRTLIWGLTVALFMSLFINVGGVTKLIPLSGMPLPFVSYGGTSLLFSWMKVGLICKAFQEGQEGQ